MALSGLVDAPEPGVVLVGIAAESGSYLRRPLLPIDRSLPGVPCPGVLGECGHQHDDGLVGQTPRGESPVAEDAFELRVKRLGVSPHAVDAAVVGIARG